ncbi:MAG: lipopolysaccharide heptosyltransferase II [Ignavibacteriales bacterium]|nr:lipopolysaccharide heptosyltransferase II [Ignavibacteriales bacterium]
MNAKSKTLVIRFSSVGDIVLSTPLLRVLRKRFPEGQVDYVTRKEYAELVRSNHNLNVTYEYDAATGFAGLRKLKQRIVAEKYDLIVDIHDSLRSKYLRSFRAGTETVAINKRKFERYMLVQRKENLYKEVVSVADRYIEPLLRFGVENDGNGLELHIPDEVLFGVSGKIAKLNLSRFEKVVGLCPSSRHFTKRWPAERFAEVGARFAKEHAAKVLIFGGPGDTELCSSVESRIASSEGVEKVTSLAGQLSLLESAAAMQLCDVIVTNDSGLMHLAAAMQKKIVALFGSTVREFGFFPVATHSVVVEREGLPCRPCSHIGRSSCPEGHFRCMKEISPGEVFEQTKKLMGAN